MKSPLATVKEKFGDKAKLVAAVKALATEELWLGRTSKDRGHDRGLEHVSNAKLLRLHAVLTEVKAKFGSREKLVEAILAAENRSKDAGLPQAARGLPGPRASTTSTRAPRSAPPPPPPRRRNAADATGAAPAARPFRFRPPRRTVADSSRADRCVSDASRASSEHGPSRPTEAGDCLFSSTARSSPLLSTPGAPWSGLPCCP